MSGGPGAGAAAGLPSSTSGRSCCFCKADLHLSSIVSRAAPGRFVCPEHALHLEAPAQDCILLYRWHASCLAGRLCA